MKYIRRRIINTVNRMLENMEDISILGLPFSKWTLIRANAFRCINTDEHTLDALISGWLEGQSIFQEEYLFPNGSHDNYYIYNFSFNFRHRSVGSFSRQRLLSKGTTTVKSFKLKQCNVIHILFKIENKYDFLIDDDIAKN